MSLNIIFMGTPEFALPILESLCNSNHKILSVYTQPAKKKARGQKILPSPVQEFASKMKIPVRSPENLNSEFEFDFIKKSMPDVVIVVAYGKILPEKILNISNIKFINIHASILPKWRGAAPIQRAIMNMDKETGISIMKIAPKLDTGPVMKISRIKINENSNFRDLSKKLSNLASVTIIEALELIEKKSEKFINQDETKASYAYKIEKKESKINWTDKAKNIVLLINALNPSPGAWFNFQGSRIRILEARVINLKGKPGEIVDKNFSIACSDKAIQILELQKAGKKIMKTKDYLMGNKITIGDIVGEI